MWILNADLGTVAVDGVSCMGQECLHCIKRLDWQLEMSQCVVLLVVGSV
jgi:hypothetical protein